VDEYSVDLMAARTLAVYSEVVDLSE
jgi:hypothetical protein